MLAAVVMFFSGCERTLTEEQIKEVASLKQSLGVISAELIDAESMKKIYPGGVLGSLIETRVQVLRVNKALMEQRISAIESGASIKEVVQVTKPDSGLATKLEGEAAALEKEIEIAKIEARNSGGLLGVLKETTVATKQLLLAQLQLQHKKAKYGLVMPSDVSANEATAGTAQNKKTSDPAKVAEPIKQAAIQAGDGPFGLTMGLKLEAFGDMAQELSPGIYKLQPSVVPTPNQLFSEYIVRIGPDSGLCWIKGIGSKFSVSSYGNELRREVDTVASMLSEKYGQGVKRDFMMPGSIWKDMNDWMMGFYKKERFYLAQWDKKLDSNLKTIFASAMATSSNEAQVIVEYAFSNETQCDKEIQRLGSKGL